MKLVLAGSPKISVPAFEKLINNFEVVAIITNIDRPKGRGLKLTETPVAILAKKYNIKLLKTVKINEVFNELEALDYDVFISFAFGQYVPERILNLGNFFPLNIHGSLLPKYRGAAPIQYAILNGDKEIGISLMVMEKEMDAGPYLFQAREELNNETTFGEASLIVSNLAEKNIVVWIKSYFKNDYKLVYQNLDLVTYSPKLKKEDGFLDRILLKRKALKIINAFNGFTGAYLVDDQGGRVKIYKASLNFSDNSLEFNFSDGSIYVTSYQYPGKKIINLKS